MRDRVQEAVVALVPPGFRAPRKIVFSTTPAIKIPKKNTAQNQRNNFICQFRITQRTFKAIASATRHAPRVIKAMVPRRRVIFCIGVDVRFGETESLTAVFSGFPFRNAGRQA